MKPAPFSYHRPSSLEAAVDLLVRYGGEAKLIAGGQSLMPMLAFRLLAPSALIDIAGIPNLAAANIDENGLTLGSRFRWVDIERDRRIAQCYPLLAEGVRHIAHYQIRNRGTIGGSLAHADPAAEFPALLLAHDGIVHVVGSNGPRTIDASSFFHGMLTTDLADDEVITAVQLPTWPAGRRWSFKEFARRSGDFAIAGIALHFEVVQDHIINPRVVAFGIDERPLVLAPLEEMLEGAATTSETIEAVARAAANLTVIDPPSDIQASSSYRRALLGVLVERGLTEAIKGRGDLI